MKVIEQAVYKESEREPGNQCSASPGAATEGGGPMCQVDHTITLSTHCRSYYHPFYILQSYYHAFYILLIILSPFLLIVDHTITPSTYCRSYYHPCYILQIIRSPSLHILPSFVSLFLESKTNSTCSSLIDIISLSDIITSSRKKGVAIFPYTRSCTLMRSF